MRALAIRSLVSEDDDVHSTDTMGACDGWPVVRATAHPALCTRKDSALGMVLGTACGGQANEPKRSSIAILIDPPCEDALGEERPEPKRMRAAPPSRLSLLAGACTPRAANVDEMLACADASLHAACASIEDKAGRPGASGLRAQVAMRLAEARRLRATYRGTVRAGVRAETQLVARLHVLRGALDLALATESLRLAVARL